MGADSFRDFVLDQLAGMPGVFCRAMFGGHGLYRGDTFFGIIHKGRLFLKTDEANSLRRLVRSNEPPGPSGRSSASSWRSLSGSGASR